MSSLRWFWSDSILSKPEHSSIWDVSTSRSSWLADAILSMLLRPSRTTTCICGSSVSSSSQKGFSTPNCNTKATCSRLPLRLKLLMHQAASRLVGRSPRANKCMTWGIRPLSMTACTWILVPAVIFDKNQTASYLNEKKLIIYIYILLKNYFSKCVKISDSIMRIKWFKLIQL